MIAAAMQREGEEKPQSVSSLSLLLSLRISDDPRHVDSSCCGRGGGAMLSPVGAVAGDEREAEAGGREIVANFAAVTIVSRPTDC